MKVFIVLFLTLFSINFCYSQEEVKDKRGFIGGSMLYSSSANSNLFLVSTIDPILITQGGGFSDVSIFSFNPYVGTQVSDNVYMGFSPSYTYASSNFDSVSSYGMDVFCRVILNPKNDVKVYLRPSLGYSYRTENPLNRILVGVSPGLMYKVNDNFQIIAVTSTGLFYETFFSENMDSSSSFTARFSFTNVSFGFEYLF